MLSSVASDQFSTSNRKINGGRSLLNFLYPNALQCQTCVNLYLSNYPTDTNIGALAYQLLVDLVTLYPLNTWAYPNTPNERAVWFNINTFGNAYPLT